MVVSIKNCDLNNDYFHFTNRRNVNSILNEGLKLQIGSASELVNDRPNVSISHGGKSIMGIINSFIYKFSRELKICDIPEDYRKYFTEISDFDSKEAISEEIACKAMARKLEDEVYFRVNVSEEQLAQANIGGLTGYDVNLPLGIDKNNIDIITDGNNKVLSAYDVAQCIYERAKNVDVFREMNSQFFHMFEMEKGQDSIDKIEITDDERKVTDK